jgi:hypothetical protein
MTSKENQKMFKIKEESLQAIGNYLLNQPYKEVANLIEMLKGVEKVDEAKEPEPAQEPEDAVEL